jgi:hypothetical protein
LLAPAPRGDTELVFRLTVTDLDGTTATDTVTLTVQGQILTNHRDRLLTGWATAMGGANVCEAYNDLDRSAREVFIWNTHRLLITDLLAGVERLYAVVGSGGSCGGFEYNRTYMVANQSLRAQFGLMHRLTDCTPHSKWRKSTDIAGPHFPFDKSLQTCFAEPRGQIHYALDPTESNRRGPNDEIIIGSDYIFEMDQDYNVNTDLTEFGKGYHDSAPGCSNMWLQYSHKYGDPNWNWQPSACYLNRRPGAAFTHNSITAGSTPTRGIYIEELRERIDSVRGEAGISAFSWTDPVIEYGVTPVKAVHLGELRTALDAAYVASGREVPIYTDSPIVVGMTPIKAVHVSELRRAVLTLEHQQPASEQ